MKLLRNRYTGDIAKYHDFRNSHMTKTKFLHIKNFLKTRLDISHARILEIGCGTGIITENFAKEFSQAAIMGTDNDVSCINFNSKRTSAISNLAFYHLDICNKNEVETFARTFGFFDFIYSVDCIHHMKSYEDFCANIKLLLRRGGYWYLSEPNSYNPYIYLFHAVTEGENNFNQTRLLRSLDNQLMIQKKGFFLIVPEFIKRPFSLLKHLEQSCVDVRFLNASVYYFIRYEL